MTCDSDSMRALACLLGQPWWAANRSLNLHTLQFGAPVPFTRRDGTRVEVGRYALHIQCAWRITDASGVVVGSRDRMTPRGNPDDVPEGFTWNEPGSTLCDEKIEQLLHAHAAAPLIVEAREPGHHGAFRLVLSTSFALEVFPDSATEEQWRFFDRHEQGDPAHVIYPPIAT